MLLQDGTGFALSGRFLEGCSKRQSSFDFKRRNDAIADLVEEREQFDDLMFQQKVIFARLGARSVLTPELVLTKKSRSC